MDLGLSAKGGIAHSIADNDRLTLENKIDVALSIDNFDAFGSGKVECEFVAPTALSLNYGEDMSVPKDSVEKSVDLKMKPLDVSIGFGDIENLLRYLKKMHTSVEQYLPKPKPKAQPEAIPEREKPSAEVKPLVRKAAMKVAADIERLKFTGFNDKAKEKYALLMFYFSNLKANLEQVEEDNIAKSREIKAAIGLIHSELNAISDDKPQSFM